MDTKTSILSSFLYLLKHSSLVPIVHKEGWQGVAAHKMTGTHSRVLVGHCILPPVKKEKYEVEMTKHVK